MKFSQMISDPYDKKILAAICLALSVFLVAGATQKLPVPGTDAVAYWPPVFMGADHGEYLNPVWPAAATYDSSGEGRLTYHGFGLQLLLRTFGVRGYESLYMALAFIGVLVIVGTAWSSSLVASNLSDRHSSSLRAMLLLSPVAAAHFFLGVFSRPETVAQFWIGAGVLCALLLKHQPRWQAAICGIFLSLTFVTSPIAGLLAALLCTCVLVTVLRRPRRWEIELVIAALSAITTTLTIFFCLYPYSIQDWVIGNLNHATRAVWTPGTTYAFHYWITETRSFGLAAVSLGILGLVLCRFRGWLTGMGRLQAVMCLMAWVTFLAAVWYFAVRVPARNYNLQVLAPAALALLPAIISSPLHPSSASKRRWVFYIQPGAIALCIFGALQALVAMVRSCILFLAMSSEGLPWTAVRDELAMLTDYPKKRSIEATLSLVAVSDEPVFHSVFHYSLAQADLLIVGQTYSGLTEPPAIDGYMLIEDHFSRVVPTIPFVSLRLASSPGLYNYAVYQRRSD
jgi:hypothetical protein